LAVACSLGEIIHREHGGPPPVIDATGVIGNIFGKRRELRLGAGKAPKLQVIGVVADRLRHAALAIPSDRRSGTVGERSIVLDKPLEGFPGEIEAVERRIAPIKRSHRAQRLCVVVEATRFGKAVLKAGFTGVLGCRMSQSVGERKRLREILVKAKGTSERASDLGDLKGMGEPRAEVVALMKDEDLRLMRQAAEGGRMDDAVAVPAEIVAGRARRLR